ncbi:MAG: hypothetical protein KatS3mg019_0897 [Fimbriimonadales bacterium]|nr:MAG: hypothetical protein KatS3mg019_0897 [Fimbriimonadales bacterium]
MTSPRTHAVGAGARLLYLVAWTVLSSTSALSGLDRPVQALPPPRTRLSLLRSAPSLGPSCPSTSPARTRLSVLRSALSFGLSCPSTSPARTRLSVLRSAPSFGLSCQALPPPRTRLSLLRNAPSLGQSCPSTSPSTDKTVPATNFRTPSAPLGVFEKLGMQGIEGRTHRCAPTQICRGRPACLPFPKGILPLRLFEKSGGGRE